MSDDTRRILDLLAQGKISVDDAERLLAAVGAAGGTTTEAKAAGNPAAAPRYLKIAVHRPAHRTALAARGLSLHKTHSDVQSCLR